MSEGPVSAREPEAEGRRADAPLAGGMASLLAAGAAALWLALCAGFWLALGEAPRGVAGWVGALVATLVPLALIALAAALARSADALRAQNAALRARPRSPAPARPRPLPAAARPAPAPPPSAAGGAAPPFRSLRAHPSPSAPPAPPALQAEEHGAEPATSDLVRALHFPEDAQDAEGFAALRRVLRSRATARLVQSAQDVLTLLAEDGVYMDDLPGPPAPVAAWRAFAAGGRGADAAPLAVVGGEGVRALAAARLVGDPIFRDAALHFARQFDAFVDRFAPASDDAALAALSGTRTARAFGLIAGASGILAPPAPAPAPPAPGTETATSASPARAPA